MMNRHDCTEIMKKSGFIQFLVFQFNIQSPLELLIFQFNIPGPFHHFGQDYLCYCIYDLKVFLEPGNP